MTPTEKRPGRDLAPTLRRTAAPSDLDVTNDLLSYLQRTGWQPRTKGPSGALWATGANGPRIAIANEVRLGSYEWKGILTRLSAAIAVPVAEIAERVQNEFVDITRLQAANDLVIAGTIPLSAGQALITSAEAMLRAASTTAVRLRGNIGGNFSRLGDEIVSRARMGHTEDGSFIVPVLMPLSRAEEGSTDEPPLLDGLERMQSAIEAPERRVTRTLAQALTALDTQVIQPGRAVNRRELIPFVEAGGSRELVIALRRILTEPAVATFEANFSWAGAVQAPPQVPATISVTSQAADLLDQAALLLRESRVSPSQVLSGPIVFIRLEPGDLFGEIGIQTVRAGRPCELHVRMRAEAIDEAHAWAVQKRAVLVEGTIRSHRGQPLRVDQPKRVVPVDETFLGPVR